MPAQLITPTALDSSEVGHVIAQAKSDALRPTRRTIVVDGKEIRTPFSSPEDWRDVWIYFLLVDRFNNPDRQPKFSDPYLPYQGGDFRGIREQLKYIRDMGAGAIWLSPVLMNPQSFTDYYGGYATQDFLRVEPRFCSDPAEAQATPEVADQEFRDLVDAIHAQGMHVILDIVLNHAGDLFNYPGMQDEAPWSGNGEYPIYWRDGNGQAQGSWTRIEQINNLPRNAGVWPKELQENSFFRRRGKVEGSPDPTQGDFGRLKELCTEYRGPTGQRFAVRDALIRAYQYLIAKFDIDGFRVDTLMYVERDFARSFANAMREFALSIGKKNFFTFGEVWMDDDESKIAEYIGRDTSRDGCGIVGFDAALDFPLRKRLEQVCKGAAGPAVLASHMEHRLNVQKTILSSHGDVGAYLVSFLENHDMNYRYATGCQQDQVTLAMACLLTLQGIPCIYYGMEQGADASGDNRESSRHCLWRERAIFSQSPQHPFYQQLADLSELRREQPALRYGRQYFRPVQMGPGDFRFSDREGGLLAWSRLLNDTELLVVANTSQTETTSTGVVVDFSLNPAGRQRQLLFTNLQKNLATAPGATGVIGGRAVVPVTLRPMEVQVLG